jgi:hypothetical protein
MFGKSLAILIFVSSKSAFYDLGEKICQVEFPSQAIKLLGISAFFF